MLSVAIRYWAHVLMSTTLATTTASSTFIEPTNHFFKSSTLAADTPSSLRFLREPRHCSLSRLFPPWALSPLTEPLFSSTSLVNARRAFYLTVLPVSVFFSYSLELPFRFSVWAPYLCLCLCSWFARFPPLLFSFSEVFSSWDNRMLPSSPLAFVSTTRLTCLSLFTIISISLLPNLDPLPVSDLIGR